MSFIKNIFGGIKKKVSRGAYYNSTPYEMEHLICGVGVSEIMEKSIKWVDYPFEPSIAFSQKMIYANEIVSICVEMGVCKIYTTNDIVFISREKKSELIDFAQNNKIPLSKYSWNWDWILDPYLDTDFTAEEMQKNKELLLQNGISEQETEAIRKEVGLQMLKYNFDTMLWDWTSLGLYDVLSAMRVKYSVEEYRDFYKRALEIDMRTT